MYSQEDDGKEFLNSLTLFKEKVSQDDSSKVRLIVGTKWYRLLVNGSTRYFVNRRNGSIYGNKTDVAPNLKQYYGTVYNHEHWNWHGVRPKPLDLEKAGVMFDGKYGLFEHYIPIR